MFGITQRTRAPVANAPFIPSIDPGTSIDKFLNDLGATEGDSRKVIAPIVAFLIEIACAADADADANRDDVRKMFVGDAYVGLKARFDATTGDDFKVLSTFIGERDSSGEWLVDLYNAAKKNPVDGDNVIGYFASINSQINRGNDIAKFINQVASFLPDMISDEAFRGILSESKWTTYRITRYSAGKILHELIGDFDAMQILQAGEADLIEASNVEPWNMAAADAIPSRLKAFASLYLEVSGRGIDKWYQGNKAVNELSANHVKSIKTVFAKYLEIKNALTGVSEATSLTELNNRTPDNLFA